jgi:hypothetical protein
MPIDDDYGIDLDDDGAHALVSHQDHHSDHDTAYKPVDSDESAYGLTKEHGHGGTSRGRSHDSDNSDSRESHAGKRSHHSDDDEKRSPKGKRSHDSDDAEPPRKVKHPREDKHSDDSHGAKRSHDSDDERSQRGKHPREDKHSDDSHGAKRSHESDDAEHPQRAKHPAETKTSHGAKHSDDAGESAQADKWISLTNRQDEHGSRSAHASEVPNKADGARGEGGTQNLVRAPEGRASEVADDLIASAYGTVTGDFNASDVPRTSYQQVDTELLTGATRGEPAATPGLANNAQPCPPGATDTALPFEPAAAPIHVNLERTPSDHNAGAGEPARAAETPVQMQPMVNEQAGGGSTAQTMLNMPGVHQRQDAAVGPQGQAVSWGPSGQPTHVRYDQPLPGSGPEMVSMGGNGTMYDARGQRIVPFTDTDTHGLIVGGTMSPTIYANPGSYSDTHGITHIVHSGDAVADSYTTQIMHVVTHRDTAGNITGYSASDGKRFTNYLEVLQYQREIDGGLKYPYSGPTPT